MKTEVRSASLKHVFDEKTLRFILVGGLNTLVGTSLMFTSYNLLGLKRLGSVGGFQDLGYWVSTAGSYLLASLVSYVLNKHFTFRDKEKGHGSLVRFALTISSCYLIAYGFAKSIILWILSDTSLPAVTQKNAAMALGMVLFVALNYVGQRYFAFRQQATADPVSRGGGDD